jgi:exodeoxyribonuclease V alpha subunit
VLEQGVQVGGEGVTEAAKILDVGPEMIMPCLDELAAFEGVIRETVPLAGREIPAV